MSAGVIEALAISAPIVASNAVFSLRRASKGADAMASNPLYGVANMDIAAGQTFKGVNAAKEVAQAAGVDTKFLTEGAGEAIKSSKVIGGIGKVIDFTANNINPIICATSALKVLCGEEDKGDAAFREGVSLGTMFASEHVAKNFLGMPYVKKENGKKVSYKRNAGYKKIDFLNKQAEALKDFCETKKAFNKVSLRFVPGALKGLGFVCASIAGYQLGNAIANGILGTKQSA